MNTCHLTQPAHLPARARYPVIDAHNHLFGNQHLTAEMNQVLEAMGVVRFCDLTANLDLRLIPGGYEFEPAELSRFFQGPARQPAGRFYCFTSATFNRPVSQPLFTDARAFADDTVECLRTHVRLGARGLKILKELGLHYRDDRHRLLRVDDDRLAPIFQEAGRLGIPVLIHQADPIAFFDPITPENEHVDTLQKYPSWSFCDTGRFPRFAELLANRDRLLRNHPDTCFILPHMASWPENLAYVSRLLDENPNVVLDFSARTDELGRQPYTAREFFIRHQDRILFGTDMPVSADMYQYHFRFLETYDEYFIPPDYDGTFSRHRWRVCGLGLPDDVLRKVYFENAARILPGLIPALPPLPPTTSHRTNNSQGEQT